MQFRMAGEADGAFWENRALDGQLHPLASLDWLNFGGDKSWPAPQSSWALQQGHDWPPPSGFDSCPVGAVAAENGVVLTSPVDPAFGIQVVRHVELDPELPVMRIRTEFYKVSGDPITASVWTIAQMQDPERVFMFLNRESKLENGYISLTEDQPADLRVDGRLLSLVRHPAKCTKIGADATSMAWVGRELTVRIDVEAGPGEYPDGGCVTQVYTNPGPIPYVELEILGPLITMSAGEQIERTTVYTIARRSTPDPETEARRILSCR